MYGPTPSPIKNNSPKPVTKPKSPLKGVSENVPKDEAKSLKEYKIPKVSALKALAKEVDLSSATSDSDSDWEVKTSKSSKKSNAAKQKSK